MFEAADDGGRHLDVRFEVSHQLWPWSGYLALYLRVKESGADYDGLASGNVSSLVRFDSLSSPLHLPFLVRLPGHAPAHQGVRRVLCTVLAPLGLHYWHCAHSSMLMHKLVVRINLCALTGLPTALICGMLVVPERCSLGIAETPSALHW